MGPKVSLIHYSAGLNKWHILFMALYVHYVPLQLLGRPSWTDAMYVVMGTREICHFLVFRNMFLKYIIILLWYTQLSVSVLPVTWT